MGFQSGKSTLLIFPAGACGDDWRLTIGSQGRQEAVPSLSLRPILLLKPHVGNVQQDTGVIFPTTAQGSRVAREQWRALLMTVAGESAEHAPSTEWGTAHTLSLTSLVPTGKKLPSMQRKEDTQ